MSSRHRVLFLDHLPAIEQTYDKAIKSGVDRPVIVVFDLSERTGRERAVALVGEKAVADLIEAARGGHRIPTLVHEFSYQDALKMMSEHTATSQAQIDRAIAANQIPVAVGGDLVTWFSTPLPAAGAAG